MPVAPLAGGGSGPTVGPPSAGELPPPDPLPAATEPLTELAARRMGPVRRFFHRHPMAMDVVVAGWFALPATAVILWGSPHLSGGQRLQLAALSAVAALALLHRRHQPVLALGVILAALAAATWAMHSSSGLEIAGILALYAVAAYRPQTVAWLCLAAYNAVHAASVALWARTDVVTVYDDAGTQLLLTDQEAFLISTSTMLALSVIALALGTAARGRRLHIATLVERTRQLALERDQREQIALTAERNRIAREMHDVVAHSLSVMVALADGASASLERRPEQARLALGELAATGRSALSDTRRLLGVLREDDGGPHQGRQAPLTPQPAVPELAELVSRFQATGLPVTLTESGPALPADAGLQLAVFRIVQEALTNVLRHAPGSPRIDVTLDRHREFVVIEVDNADGAATPSRAGGRGLVGMRERAAVYDGHVEAGPTTSGWRVRAVLRWTEDELG